MDPTGSLFVEKNDTSWTAHPKKEILLRLEHNDFVFYRLFLLECTKNYSVQEIERVSSSCCSNVLLIMHFKTVPLEISRYIITLLLKDSSNYTFMLFKTLNGHGSGITTAAFSGDGKKVLSSSRDSTARLWDLESGQQVLQLKTEGGCFCSMTFSLDGKIIYTGSEDGRAHSWDSSTGVQLAELFSLKRANRILLSIDGTLLLTEPENKVIGVWDIENERSLAQFVGHREGITAAAFSPDGTKLLTGSWDKSVCLWDISAKQRSFSIKHHTHWISSVVFSTDQKTFLTGSFDRKVCVWNSSTGELIRELRHDESVTSVAISTDGKTILTGSHDKMIYLWDAKSGTQLLQLKGHEESVSIVLFSPDEKTILTGSFDHNVCIWCLDSSPARQWIDQKSSLVQAWLLVRASEEKRAFGHFHISENSLEYAIFESMPSDVQEYMMHWFSLKVKE